MSKPATSAGKPATSRMSTQGARGGRGEEQQQGRGGQPPAQDSNKTTLYIGIGGGALLFVIILAFMLSGNESSGGGGGGGEAMITKAMNRATEAYQRGEYRQGLDICEEALRDPRARKSSRYNALNQLANQLKGIISLDATAQVKVGEFKKKIETAKADQTAMAKANDLYAECLRLLGEYGTTTSGKDLRGIKEDLGRWVSTEGQGNWQKDYNVTKARIEKTFLGDQRFGEGIREWQRFGETSADPLLHSRIEQEIRSVNQLAQAAAEKIVAEAAGDRTKLEEASQKFSGTDGQAVINKAMRGAK